MSKFRPCIDLHNGKVKQIVGGTLSDADSTLHTNFESELGAAYYANLYKQDGLTGGHVIMLGGGNEAAALSALQAYPKGLQLGGGITPENAGKYLQAGADKVIATSYVFRNGELDLTALEKLVSEVGKANLVLDLSCRWRNDAYYIVTDRWQKFTRLAVNSATLHNLAEYCAEFLIHAVDVEGKQAGIDEKLLHLMAENTPIPATYAGGIRSLADVEKIAAAGQGKIDYTIGSALDIFGGSLPYKNVLNLKFR